MLKAGDRIPDFDLATDRGERVSPKALRGSRAVLYFYPKDDTPGCTVEACAFRDALPKFDAGKVRVYGISADDAQRHAKFVGKYQLNFPLIADPEHQAIKGFGVWIEKSLYGRKYMGIARATFAIDANGKIERVWDKVKPATHAEEVLAWLTGTSVGAVKPATKKAAPTKQAAVTKVVAKKAPAGKAAAKKGAPKKGAAKRAVAKAAAKPRKPR